MQTLFISFEINYGYCSYIFNNDIPIIYKIFYMFLPEQYLLGRSKYIKMQYKLYANALQRSYFKFYLLFFYLLSLVYFIKFYKDKNHCESLIID